MCPNGRSLGPPAPLDSHDPRPVAPSHAIQRRDCAVVGVRQRVRTSAWSRCSCGPAAHGPPQCPVLLPAATRRSSGEDRGCAPGGRCPQRCRPASRSCGGTTAPADARRCPAPGPVADHPGSRPGVARGTRRTLRGSARSRSGQRCSRSTSRAGSCAPQRSVRCRPQVGGISQPFPRRGSEQVQAEQEVIWSEVALVSVSAQRVDQLRAQTHST